jgi:hypothetical protein
VKKHVEGAVDERTDTHRNKQTDGERNKGRRHIKQI